METAVVPAETKKAVMLVQQKANALTVSTPDEAEAGAELLRTITDAEKGLIERKEEITRPLMRSLASVRDLFKPFELGITDAKKTVKSKLLAYNIEQQEAADKEKAKIEARVAKGTMKAETAAGKLGAIAEPAKVKGIQTRTLIKIRVVDETLIPREYLVPDMAKITEAVLRQGVDVPGVEKYEDKVIASV